ncbi:Lysine-specific demethylase REF6 [Quillaja saponaria]|uniref:Lysine-specific demethylase REF6 n=1 Tax=Quillaja saponaria TaxID=32244 RepID=A0AAD7LEV8_QUISA|nr:Lysine-specific demethylase REF6 [Quillaja saponaria]
MAGSATLPSEPNPEVLSWLKSLPLAPEYHPTLAEFQDPISYIFKIEKEASKYGICKIVPPVQPSPKKTAIANLNRSLAARAASSGSSTSKSQPTFTTRQQQIGFCPRKPRPVRRPVWQSGDNYTFQEFEAKAKAFEKNYLKKCVKKGGLSPLEIETLYWNATVDKPFSVEYANDMPGSAFAPLGAKKCREAGEGVTLGETAWNMRGVSRANGSLLRFMKEEIPGVTSPMVYVAMMFSWFAWHVEDHDLHSLNYLHMGAGKTWYGVPKEAAVAFEEVVRVHGYGGEINPLVTFATLGEKTTVMSPEVFISAGIPCCRLVQNAGEFVVTFPRAYHTGFSLGFNCGEAANIATPEWLRVAKDAAIRRASINYPPMVSHFQLLYDLALALCSRIPVGISAEPRSSRLKDKKKGEGDTVVKKLFVQNVVNNNDLLHILGKGSSIVLLPRSSSDISVCSKLRVGSQLKVNPGYSLGLCNSKEGMNLSKGLVTDDTILNRNHGIQQVKGFYSVKGKFSSFCERNRVPFLTAQDNICTLSSKTLDADTERETNCDGLSNQRLFSCVTCGILSFACVAIIQPREPAARYLMSAACSSFNDWLVGSGVTSELNIANGDAITFEPNSLTGWMEKRAPDGLYDVPVQTADYQIQIADRSHEVATNSEAQKDMSALGLLASTYGNSSDSEEDEVEHDLAVDCNESNLMNCPAGSRSQHKISCLPSYFQDCHGIASGTQGLPLLTYDDRDGVDHYEDFGHRRANSEDRSPQNFDCSVESEDDDIASIESDGCEGRNFKPVSESTSDSSQDINDAEQPTFSKALLPMDNKDTSFSPQSDEDSSRVHVFCLEHAAEVEQQLRSIGGVHILLLCHPDYPKIEAEAKSAAEELGIDYLWNDISYRQASKEDEQRIHSALDSEEAISGNGDWAVKLGVNLFYSANLSRSTLYSKQMPYNAVIYNAFGRSSPVTSPTEPKVYQRRGGKQKKVVAGKWCGKVWMSNQVHPLLAKRDPEDDIDNDNINFHGWALPDEKLERESESIDKSETNIRKSGRKRKMSTENGLAKKAKNEKDVVLDNTNLQHKSFARSKQAKCNERDDAASDHMLVDHPLLPGRIPVSKRTKRIERDDAISDDSLDDYSDQQHRKIINSKGPGFIDRDVVSDASREYNYHLQHGRFLRSKQAKDLERNNSASDDLLGGSSLQQHEKVKLPKYIDGEDKIFDNQINHSQEKQRRVPKGRQVKGIPRKDLLGNHPHQRRRSVPRSRQDRCIGTEDTLLDDPPENNSHLPYKVYTRKQVKCVERDDIHSDDLMGNDSLQQHRRSLRSNQTKSETLEQKKQDNPGHVKQQTPQSIRGMRQLMKPKTPQQMKQPSWVRNNQSANSGQFSLCIEEEQEGGPSTRLRKRAPKTLEFESKPKEKQMGKKKVKNASTVKAPSSYSNAKRKDEEEYQCDIEGCTMSFDSKQELVLHKKNVCPVKGCGKKFFSHKYLVQHRRVHMDDRPLRCPWKGCKMTFKWAWARTEHIRVHTGARPYICAERGCGQTFRFVSDFSRHKRKTGHSVKKSR